MSVTYRQCHATLGAVVRLRESDGDWGDGWDVASVGPFTLSEDTMRKAERSYTRQRKASDLSRADRKAPVD